MTALASTGQLRAALIRWALFLVPGVLLLGFLSGKLAQSGPGNAWFDALTKPPLYPPPQTFAIAWTALYVLMGLAAAMVAAARGARWRRAALIAFAVQFALNLAWTPVFFAAHRITAALVVIVLLDLAVIATIVLFARVRTLAAWLLAPYLTWILFATALTWQFLAANPAADGAEGSAAVTRIEI